MLLGLSLFVCSAYPWSTPGHRVVAGIAEKHLNSVALKNVQALLQGQSMADVSNWADQVGRSRREAAGWHFINIPIEVSDPDPDKFCHPKDCVLSKVNQLMALLKSTSGTPKERSEALKYVIHLVADLHQPLHVGNREDRGGFKLQLIFFDLPTNLHMVWDHELLARQGLDEATLITQLDGLAQERWSRGTPRDWVLESFAVAREVAYNNVSGKLGSDYLEQCTPLVRTQLAKAGIRLAKVLNEIWN
jgi:hypothetical protein